MSTRNSSALNRKSGFHDNEAEAEPIILICLPFGHFGFQIQSHLFRKLSTALWTWPLTV